MSKDIAEAMNKTAAEFPAEVNEFEIAGLTSATSELIAPPRVAESPVSLECRLKQVVMINEGSQKECGLVIAEVIYCHIKDGLFDGRYIDMKGLEVVGRLGGHSYCNVDNLFEMKLPTYKK